MRRNAKVDANHVEVVGALKKAGASVLSLATIGKGAPDLVVGFRGVNYLIEVKDGTKPKSQRTLTPHQILFHRAWHGSLVVAECPEDALFAIGATQWKRPKTTIKN